MKNRSANVTVKGMSVVLVGIICALFALALKKSAEGAEHFLFQSMNEHYSWLVVVAPFTGLLLVFFVTQKLFRSPISGINEIIGSQREPIQPLKPVNTILHFMSGFLTLSFGGSTGIEVPTVVASATTGSWTAQRWGFDEDFKRKLILAGAAAGISGLFKSPLAGLFFVIEVLMLNFSWEIVLLCAIASLAAFGTSLFFDSGQLFHPVLNGWTWDNIPYFILFSFITALLSVYLTRGVIKSKSVFATRFKGISKVLVGGAFLGIMMLMFAPLYGDGYSIIELLLEDKLPVSEFPGVYGIVIIVFILLLKPFATAITLAAGGNGGVFAPSLFLGAVSGFLFGHLITFLGGSVIEVNFIIVGMAGILGASLHAPLTAAFLTMSITGSYELFVPIILTADLSAWLAKRIYPFTVYSYSA